MEKRKQVREDADRIDKVMRNYTGSSAAHFGFIVCDTGERQFFAGGRADLTGMCLGEAIANLVKCTPGVGEEFIDAVADTAHAVYENMITEKKEVQ